MSKLQKNYNDEIDSVASDDSDDLDELFMQKALKISQGNHQYSTLVLNNKTNPRINAPRTAPGSDSSPPITAAINPKTKSKLNSSDSGVSAPVPLTVCKMPAAAPAAPAIAQPSVRIPETRIPAS